jgi:hypothetical protein
MQWNESGLISSLTTTKRMKLFPVDSVVVRYFAWEFSGRCNKKSNFGVQGLVQNV